MILVEPEIGFGEDILVPDLAGWKAERFPRSEDHNWISVAPDWACEVLSPNTARYDRVERMPIYAMHEVRHVWLIDPILTTLEVFRLESGRWVLPDAFAGRKSVRVEPFSEIEISLASRSSATGAAHASSPPSFPDLYFSASMVMSSDWG